MRTAKSYKIVLTILALVMALASCVLFFNVKTAKAEDVASSFVTVSNAEVKFDGEGENRALVASAIKTDTKTAGSVTFRNNLVIDDFALEFGTLADEIEKIDIDFITKSYIVTGNKNADGGFDTKITNTVTLINRGEKDWIIYLNGNTANSVQKDDAGDGFTLYVKTENNALGISVNGIDFTYEDRAYYKVETIDKTVTTSGIKITARVSDSADNGEYGFSIKSIDQRALAATNEYKQTFAVGTDGEFTVFAKPLVKISDSFFTRTADGKYYPIVYNGTQYSVTYTVYSFFGGKFDNGYTATSSNVAPKEDSNGVVAYTSKKLQFNVKAEDIANNNNTVILSIGYKKSNTNFIVFSNYDVKVVNKSDDSATPAYFDIADNLDAIESFENALKEKYQTVTDGVTHSVVLGNSMDLPSFKSLVYDDTSSYDELKYTVHYFGPTTATTGTTSSLKFTLNAAGTYTFYVAFKDANGNQMETADFLEKDGDSYVFGKYCAGENNVDGLNYVFRFKVDDDAPIMVTAPSADSIGRGNVGTQYTAPEFTINASGFDTGYALYYNSNKNATRSSTGWVEIPKASSVSTNKAYDKDGYTYADIMAIAYDGVLQFTPDKEGAYMIVCTVTSNVSTRSESAYQVIAVDAAKASVDPSEPLPARNVWAIVFLSVGSLCLIGIVVLLFVKPKESTAEGKEKPAKKNKE